MTAFIVRRLLQSMLVLFLFSVGLLGLLNALPGDPVMLAMFSRPDVTQEDVLRMRKLWRLDDPFPVKYATWVKRVFVDGDMGYSRTEGRPVREVILEYTANSLRLMGVSFVVSLVVAIPLGIIAALHRQSVIDYVTSFVALLGVSIPSFWLGIVAVYVFSVHLRWLPSSGMQGLGDDAGGFFDRLRYLVLPAVVLSVQTIAVWVRYMRASLLEVVHEDYLRTARAKGLPESRVIGKHALRNALIPIVTLLALSIPALFSGALVTETIFSWPGMGRLLYRSVVNHDQMVAMIAFLILAALTTLCNLVADVLNAVVDPRIRLE